MKEREYLGNFETMVLLSLLRLGEGAYGVPITGEIEKQSGRPVAVGSVYAALERLERKGLVTSHWGEPTAERGGRAKKHFTVTTSGLKELRHTQKTLINLWRGVPELKG
jgi:DNA-binding PadR family transcriptional regulator